MSTVTILLVLAIICWFIAAVPIPTGPVSVGWLGMVFWGVSMLVGH